jgi:pyruvate/2-oxoglutarate dehydrogenase complex dihydrolipoamide acyltransferase (E2) component
MLTAWAEAGGSAWNATKCVDHRHRRRRPAGDDPECTTPAEAAICGIDDCALACMCWDVVERDQMCRRHRHLRPLHLCTGNTDDAPGAMCPTKPSTAPACDPAGRRPQPLHPQCDPLLQDCPGDDLCIPTGDKFILRPRRLLARWAPSTTPANSPTPATRASSASTPPAPRAPASKAPRAAASPSANSRAPPARTPTRNASNGTTPCKIPPGYEDIGFCASRSDTMRPIYTLPLSALLACGPLAPPLETTTAASSDTGDHHRTRPRLRPPPPPQPQPPRSTRPPSTPPPPNHHRMPFVIKPDGGPDSIIECDVFAQDCDPGQKCVPWAEGGGGAWNATKCVDITGDGAPGDPCTAPEGGVAGIDDCALGSHVLGRRRREPRHLRRPVHRPLDAPVCPPQIPVCSPAKGSSTSAFPDCDPLLQDCPGDDLCIPTATISPASSTPPAKWAPPTTPANSPTPATRASSASTPPTPRAPASKAPRAAASPSASSRAPPARTPTSSASNGSTP